MESVREVRWHAWRLAGTVVVIACAASAAALAARGYAVGVSASSPVGTNHSFRVKARGVAGQRALLYVYLDRRPCPPTWNTSDPSEGDRRYASGDSYFVVHDGGPAKQLYSHAWVSGVFKKSFTGHAGATPEAEYACAYLETPNRFGGYRVTAAHGSSAYAVKR